ncbi:MAG: ribose-phosphate pyrophosphokinase [Calditrichaeota bacterium]|nr:ribose-phosphate pyrophosphokinase [Calditrichota bacterium]
MKIFTGTAHPELAARIAKEAGLELGSVELKRFADGEIWVKFNENIRGRDVFLIQPTKPPAENLLELLILIDAAKRASASRITAVIPYFAYARQDRKDQPRVPITARLVADLIEAAGADRVLAMDLHAPQIQGFFKIPFDHIHASKLYIDWLRENPIPNLVIVAPDVGSIKLARFYATQLNTGFAVVDKHRERHDQIAEANLIGEVAERPVLLVDDMIDTGNTFIATVEILKKRGAREITALITHPVFSGDAVANIEASQVKEVFICDTLPTPQQERFRKIHLVSTAKIFAEALLSIHHDRSLSSLFVQQLKT